MSKPLNKSEIADGVGLGFGIVGGLIALIVALFTGGWGVMTGERPRNWVDRR